MNVQKQRSSDYQEGLGTGFVYAKAQQAIEAVTTSTGGVVSRPQLAVGVANLLLSEAGGHELRPTHRVQSVRASSPKPGKAMAKVAVVGSSRTDRPRVHWTQLPKNKAKMKASIRKMLAAKNHPKVTRKLSKVGARAISLAQKARWAKLRAA